MAKAKLFNSKEALLEGYCDLNRTPHLDNYLSKGKGGRKVYLLGRVLPSGNISLMRYSCSNGKRQREMLNVVLKLEVDANVKRENEEKLRLQALACDALNADLERREANFQSSIKSKVLLLDFIRQVGEAALKETGNRHSMYATMNSLAKHVEAYAGTDTRFKEVNEDWLRGFIDYLKHDALNVNYTRSEKEGRRKEIHISQNTQHRLIVNINHVLNKAVKKHLITSNPMDLLDNSDKVSAKSGTREYLTSEEVELLMQTPFTHGKYHIKEAFLFSCYTGLRFSDLKQLKMSDFHFDRKHGWYLKIKMVKTKEPLTIFIPNVAYDLLPDTEDEERPVFDLPKNDYANQALQRWLKDAGIKGKHITFHCARHSAATILYSAGLPLQTIQKQLGHIKAQTTEIYAKMMEDAQHEASSKMDELFKR